MNEMRLASGSGIFFMVLLKHNMNGKQELNLVCPGYAGTRIYGVFPGWDMIVIVLVEEGPVITDCGPSAPIPARLKWPKTVA